MQESFRLTPGKRVLFLTKDPALIERQLAGQLDLRMDDLRVEDLLDEINTDTMTPAWVCFDHDPREIAKNAYAGLIVAGKRLIPPGAIAAGNFEVIVSGHGKGVGSSRETAAQAEKYSGIRLAIAASFAPIHARNNINQGVLMGDHALLSRLQKGASISIDEFCAGHDPVTQAIIRKGDLFSFTKALMSGEAKVPPQDTGPRPMTMCEKIVASHILDPKAPRFVKPGDAVMVRVDGGYSHEFTTAQVHEFLREAFGEDYRIASDPQKFAVFEDHLIYSGQVASYQKHMPKIERLVELQRAFAKHTGVLSYAARDGRSPGICHQVARERIVEPGDFIQATDSHTCMGGGSNAYAFGVGTTEYAALIYGGFTTTVVPETIRFELTGRLAGDATAKDVMLWILLHHAKTRDTLNRCMEFGGPGLAGLSMDERATLANMATECTAKGGIVEADEETVRWIAARRPDLTPARIREKLVRPDADAQYSKVVTVDLSRIRPMVAHPGDPDRGVPSDPTNGALVAELGKVKIDIAYGGSCTAGKEDDLDLYARVMQEADEAGMRVHPDVRFFIQFGSEAVARYAESRGYLRLFERTGVTVIPPGCGACIGCGPGVSEREDQVTVSAINRNYKGRSGPGRLYLASPLTVAASAVKGEISGFHQGMFRRQA